MGSIGSLPLSGGTLTPEASLIEKMRIIPQRWFNPYPASLANTLRDSKERTTHARYQPGDFVLSFSGCNKSFSAEECNKAFEEAYRIGLSSYLDL